MDNLIVPLIIAACTVVMFVMMRMGGRDTAAGKEAQATPEGRENATGISSGDTGPEA